MIGKQQVIVPAVFHKQNLRSWPVFMVKQGRINNKE